MLALWLDYRLDWIAFALFGLGALGAVHLFLRRSHGLAVPWPVWRLLTVFLLAGGVLAEWTEEAG